MSKHIISKWIKLFPLDLLKSIQNIHIVKKINIHPNLLAKEAKVLNLKSIIQIENFVFLPF